MSNYGSWIGRNGEKSTYFDGSSGDNICACGKGGQNSCIEQPHLEDVKCNCDARIPNLGNDMGIITNKVLLLAKCLLLIDICFLL